MQVVREPPLHAELVFHVLAHVRASAALPSSVFDPAWIAFAERWMGPAAERPLGEDAAALGALVSEHRELAELQLLAWLFEDPARAAVAATRGLATLGPEDVDAPELLDWAKRAGPAAELLLIAVGLERPLLSLLPRPELDWEPIEAGFSEMQRVAPGLAECSIALVRSLRLRGRVRGDAIWVGAPDPAHGLALEHVLWQAAHEASVREVARHSRAEERRIEAMAVVLLAERARREGREGEHAVWLAHFGPHAPRVALSSLTPEEGDEVSRLLRR